MTDPDDCWPGDPDGAMTAEEYEALLYDAESPVPGEFIRTPTGVWFVRGRDSCVGGKGYHLWHTGMDPVYAAGSCIAAGVEVPLSVLREATDILKCILENERGVFELSEKAKAHLRWLVTLGETALAAEPNENVQYVE